jgi:outer membrane protein assembly factor BamB
MVGMTNGLLMGFNLKKADAKGNETLLDVPTPAWNWHAGTAIRTRPLPSENIVAWGGGDSKVYCVMGSEATELLRIATGGPIGAGLGAHGTRTLLAPSADFNLYAIDILTGRVIWTFPSGAPIEQEPLVGDQDVYIVNNAGNLTRLDPVSGERLWTTSTQGGRLASISATKLYLRSYDLDLFMVDRATGRMVVDPSETHLRAGLNLRDFDMSIVNRFDDRIYFATSSGLVVALREIGQTQPRPLRDPNAKPLGYVPPEGIKLTPPPTESAEPGAAEPKTEPGPAGGEAPPATEKGAAPKEGPGASPN